MSQGRRTTPLPKDWQTIRLAVLERDGRRCTWTTDGERCVYPATDVDHMGRPDQHELHLLRSLCRWHHDRRTSAQANAAKPRERRAPEPHPGELP